MNHLTTKFTVNSRRRQALTSDYKITTDAGKPGWASEGLFGVTILLSVARSSSVPAWIIQEREG
jgi:hypothetical protein